jgi:hypothetical protein
MSRKADEEYVLHTLATEGGRLKLSRLIYDGILAAGRLARANLARTGKQAEGWDLVLARQEPAS